MENLNAEQVIKALECCVKVGGYRDAEICNDCPLSEKRCAILLPENALALIKELTEHIHNLEQSRDYWKAKSEKLAKKLRVKEKETMEGG